MSDREETKEFKALKNAASSGVAAGKKLWTVPSGMAGLLFWAGALITAFNHYMGAVFCFGIGLIMIVKAKKELKAKEEAK